MGNIQYIRPWVYRVYWSHPIYHIYGRFICRISNISPIHHIDPIIFMIRNWFTWLWRLTSPKIYCQQAGDSAIREVNSVQRPAGSSPQNSRCFGLSLTADKNHVPARRHSGIRNSLILSLFVLFWPSTHCTRSIHMHEEGLLIYSFYRCKFILTLTNIPGVWPGGWAPHCPARLTTTSIIPHEYF